jgi:hypothetical protein
MEKMILDSEGKPIKTGSKRTNWLFVHIKKHWEKWLSIIAIIISISSVVFTCKSDQRSHALSKLEFSPEIKINAYFKKIGKHPPHFVLENVGPLDASQIEIRMISHEFSDQAGKIIGSKYLSQNDLSLPMLGPQDRKAFKFKEEWINVNAKLQVPGSQLNHIMEIQINYKRPQDLKNFDLSAYYFINPEGIWAKEGSSSLNDPIYSKMLENLMEWKHSLHETSLYNKGGGDILHSNLP